MASRVLPRSWRELARPFAIALVVLLIFAIGVIVSDAFDMRTEWVLFTLVGFPLIALQAISYAWLWKEFDAEAAQRGWEGPKRRKELLTFLVLGPLYLWVLRRSP